MHDPTMPFPAPTGIAEACDRKHGQISLASASYGLKTL